ASKYRTVRERYPDDTSPQRRTATIVRRVPDSAIVEGKTSHSLSLAGISSRRTRTYNCLLFLISQTICYKSFHSRN
ncbi:unnamed protein product, partial [Rotaria magnacalcarata]